MSNEEPYATGSQFLDAWQEMTETATKQTRESVARSQDIIIDAVSAWSRTVQTLIPTSVPADLASQAPKPSDLVESGFKIAEELLHAQHQFARRLLEAVQPAAEQAAEAAAGAADAAADAAVDAAQADQSRGGPVKQAINKVRGDS